MQAFIDDVAVNIQEIRQVHNFGNLYHTVLIGECPVHDFTLVHDREYVTLSGTGIRGLDNTLVYFGDYAISGLKTVTCSIICRDPIRQLP